MKILKFNESVVYVPSNDEDMASYISDIMSNELIMRPIPYSNDEWEIDPNSVLSGAKDVIKELKKLGIDFDLLYSVKKYNL